MKIDAKKMLGLFVLIVVIVGLGMYALYGSPTSLTSQQAAVAQALNEFPTVTYTDSGFIPSTLTVHAGDTVAFTNTSNRMMHVSSSDYPTPSPFNCAETLFDECASLSQDQSWSFTFSEVGTWHYTNAENPDDAGVISVAP